MKGAGQAKEQARPRKRIRSPRSGAEIETPNATSFQPGKSGNPEGSSRRVRTRQAFESVFDTPTLVASFQRLAGIVAGKTSKDGDAVQGLRLLADVEALREPESDARPVDVRITFRNRSSGAEAEIEVTGGDGAKEGGVEL